MYRRPARRLALDGRTTTFFLLWISHLAARHASAPGGPGVQAGQRDVPHRSASCSHDLKTWGPFSDKGTRPHRLRDLGTS
jgi:hypothetical protein